MDGTGRGGAVAVTGTGVLGPLRGAICRLRVFAGAERTLASSVIPAMGKAPARSYARLTPFLRGFIYGLSQAGSTLEEIRDEVEKPDGSRPCSTAISDTIRRARGGARGRGHEPAPLHFESGKL